LGTQKKSWDSSRGFFLCKKKAQSHHISRREGGRGEKRREEKRRGEIARFRLQVLACHQKKITDSKK